MRHWQMEKSNKFYYGRWERRARSCRSCISCAGTTDAQLCGKDPLTIMAGSPALHTMEIDYEQRK